MTRSLFTVALAAALLAAGSLPAAAAGNKQNQKRTRTRTRSVGGPAALGGVTPETPAGDIVRVQQERARRGAVARQRRMSPREQILAARDRQLGGGASVSFTSRHQAAAYTRTQARLTQIRTFAVAVATGIGGGFLAKMITAVGVLSGGGYHDPLGDPNFGNPIAQMLDHNFAVGAIIGAGIAIVVGSVKAAHLRRKADRIERGEVDVDLARLD